MDHSHDATMPRQATFLELFQFSPRPKNGILKALFMQSY